jgi:riboflavin-specific deaminase-like protein
VEFRQLLPDCASVQLPDLLAGFEPVRAPASGRPYVFANFVASVDGRATFQGRLGPLGDDGDHALFHGLRQMADAVLVGTNTLRTERYGRILSRPERRESRIAAGRSPDPLACIVTRTGHLPTDIPLFAEPEQEIVVFAAAEVDLSGVTAQVEVVRLEHREMTLTTALEHLRADHGVRLVLCEGGPTLFASMLHEGVVDELFLTLAPKLTGGGASPTITAGPELPELCEVMTIWLLERAGSLYLRLGLPEST